LTSFSLRRTLSARDTGESRGLSGGGSKSKTSWFQPCVKKKGDTPVEAAFRPQIALTPTCNHSIQLSCAQSTTSRSTVWTTSLPLSGDPSVSGENAVLSRRLILRVSHTRFQKALVNCVPLSDTMALGRKWCG